MAKFVASVPGRHKLLAFSLTVLIIAAGLILASRWPLNREPSSARPKVPPLVSYPITIVPGVHLLGRLSPAAAYVVETSRGLVLVDSGMESDATSVKRQMASLKLDWRRLRAILLTHAHADHCLGAQHLREATGAPIYAGRKDSAVLRAGGPREALFSTYQMPEVKVHPTTVDVELKGGEVIDFGEARVTALATPGHTAGSICYLLERNDVLTLFSGDFIRQLRGEAPSGPVVSTALGTFATYLPPRYGGDARAFLSSLRRLRKIRAPDLVLPGHPNSDDPPQSPVMSPQRWETLLDGGIHEMERLLARRARDGANYRDGVPKKLLPALYYLGDFKGAAVYGFFVESKLVVVDAPGGPGLTGFLTTGLRRLGVQPAVPTAVLLTSCGPKETAGLNELVEKTHALVVASAAGIPQLKEACPSGTVFLAAADLPRKGWFPVKTIPLRGRGLAPVAYEIVWCHKTVLFSGRIPIEIGQTTVQGLFQEFSKMTANPGEYRVSLDQLDELRPNLWLPALSAHGQNANLYDDDWQRIIANNRKLVP
jgi:glyoxylase-like metal-dependent hydrolase (beta-lactamase superfamily II)